MAVGVADADLFEIARAYLARPGSHSAPASPVEEPLLLAVVVGGDFAGVKGLAEAVFAGLGVSGGAGGSAGAGLRLRTRPLDLEPFVRGRAAEVMLEQAGRPAERVAVMGEVSAAAIDRFGLAGPVVAAELRLDRLEFAIATELSLVKPSDFPALQRDVNLVVDEAVAWGDVEDAIRLTAGDVLETCRLVQVWQDADRLGAGRKSFVVALTLRSGSGTLSGEEAGRVVDAVVAECGRRVAAVLRG